MPRPSSSSRIAFRLPIVRSRSRSLFVVNRRSGHDERATRAAARQKPVMRSQKRTRTICGASHVSGATEVLFCLRVHCSKVNPYMHSIIRRLYVSSCRRVPRCGYLYMQRFAAAAGFDTIFLLPVFYLSHLLACWPPHSGSLCRYTHESRANSEHRRRSVSRRSGIAECILTRRAKIEIINSAPIPRLLLRLRSRSKRFLLREA